MYKKDISIVISSDMSHFLSEEEQEIKDKDTISKIHNLDYNNLENGSMCGFFCRQIIVKICL